jgi:putative FmdB family regulatory protein
MPIYEYRCAGCKRRVSIFFPSISAAHSRTAAGEVHCPHCGSADLTRLMSRAYTIRGSTSTSGGEDYGDYEGYDSGGPGDEDMGMDGMNGMDGMGGMDSMLEGLDDEDPRAIARWARRMKEVLGPEADLGPEFDRALARIEAGEDPDKVMEDLDPEALGGAGTDGDEALGEDSAGDDFDEV